MLPHLCNVQVIQQQQSNAAKQIYQNSVTIKK